MIRARIALLEDEIGLSEVAGEKGAAADEARSAARRELATAREALGEGGRSSRRSRLWHGLKRRWTGSDQEQAWLAVHAAECHLALVEPDEAMRAELPALEAKIRARLKATDPLRTTWVAMLAKARESSSDPPRYAVRQIKETLFAASDAGHTRTRSFRNVLVVVTGILTIAAVLLAFPAVSDWIPLDTASAGATTSGVDGADTTPSDPEESPAEDSTEADEEDSPVDRVWQVELLGAFGGLLAALGAIQRLRGFRSPYNLPLVQAFLKIPAGALTALAGIVLMQSGVLFLQPQAGTALAAYAIFFGVAQDVVTRLVDRKAREITEAADPVEAAVGG